MLRCNCAAYRLSRSTGAAGSLAILGHTWIDGDERETERIEGESVMGTKNNPTLERLRGAAEYAHPTAHGRTTVTERDQDFGVG